ITRAGEAWTTPAVTGTSVDIWLEETGGANPSCPDVILRAELSGGHPANPRGVVGPDDRWDVASQQLRALGDASTISAWAPSVVHLQVFDALHGLPCTGFFIAPHLVMTARHCVMTADEA